jgi:DNA-binding LacI/PurR family transcriptional regulator
VHAGARRIGFAFLEHQASTVALRLAGFQAALALHGLRSAGELKLSVDHGATVAWKREQFDALVCANDRIAGTLMHSLLQRGVRIPAGVRIVGIDDVHYASLLPVPLTTVRQPCREIGETALRTMLERIDRPAMAARNVLLDCSLVIRRSCGSG